MTLVPLTDCCRLLGIDAKTLRKWLQHAYLKPSAHPRDARLKCLTIEQVQQLATLYGRPPLAPASAPSALLEGASARLAKEMPAPADPLPDAPPPKTLSMLPAPVLQEADLIEKLAGLETKVTTMQEQLAQLALELLQERRLSSERRLSALETLLPPKLDPSAYLQEREALVEAHPPQGSSPHERRLHPAELRARSRVIPLIEYGVAGTYVLICPKARRAPPHP